MYQHHFALTRYPFETDLEPDTLFKVGLEIEGQWDPSGKFVATDIEILPRIRRPKLRGAIQDLPAEWATVILKELSENSPV